MKKYEIFLARVGKKCTLRLKKPETKVKGWKSEASDKRPAKS